jgi:predicted nucleotidyltransferase
MARLAEGARKMLAERAEVVEVRLFGSLARGDARPGSDADLLVVLRETPVPFLDRSPLLSPYLKEAGVGCDIFAYTETELERLRSEGNTLVRAADAEGIFLARREPSPESRRS